MQQNIGSILRYLREEHDKKQSDISDYLNISSQAYSNYERGRRTPDIAVLLKLAHYYQIDYNWLLSFLVPKELANFLLNQDNNAKDSASTFSIPALNLTSEEFKLLTEYRKLSPESQSDILLFTGIKAKHPDSTES